MDFDCLLLSWESLSLGSKSLFFESIVPCKLSRCKVSQTSRNVYISSRDLPGIFPFPPPVLCRPFGSTGAGNEIGSPVFFQAPSIFPDFFAPFSVVVFGCWVSRPQQPPTPRSSEFPLCVFSLVPLAETPLIFRLLHLLPGRRSFFCFFFFFFCIFYACVLGRLSWLCAWPISHIPNPCVFLFFCLQPSFPIAVLSGSSTRLPCPQKIEPHARSLG